MALKSGVVGHLVAFWSQTKKKITQNLIQRKVWAVFASLSEFSYDGDSIDSFLFHFMVFLPLWCYNQKPQREQFGTE